MRRQRRVPRQKHVCELQEHIDMTVSQLRFETSFFAEHASNYALSYLEERREERFGEVTFLTWLSWAIRGQLCPAGCPFSMLGRN